jgi:hypothetical protein
MASLDDNPTLEKGTSLRMALGSSSPMNQAASKAAQSTKILQKF